MNFFLRWFFLFVSVPFFGACIAYHPKPISAEKAAADFQARTLQDPVLKTFLEKNLKVEIKPWPPASWDLDLLTLVAFYYHPDLDVARAKWGGAQAAIRTAGGRPNPTLSFVPEFVSNNDFNSPWLFGFSFDIPIETAGKRGYRIAQAQHLSEASRLNIASVAWQVRSRLRQSLLNLYSAKEAQAFLKRQLDLQTENVHLLETRASANSVSQIVLTDAELQRNQTLLALQEEQKKETEARAQVASALGVPVSSLEGVRFSFRFLERFPKDLEIVSLHRQALFNRWDILAGLAEYAAAESALQLEIAKQYPDVHLSPGYTFDQGQNKWALGISITPPLFNRNRGPIAEAEAHRTEAEARFNALQARILGELDQTLAAYRGALKKLKTTEDLLIDQKKKQQIVSELSSPGELRRVSLLQAELEMEATALSHLNVLIQAQQSLGFLEDAVERPLESKSSSFEIPETNPRTSLREKEHR